MVLASVTFDVELTEQEARALSMLQDGRTNGQIARSLVMSLDEMHEMLAGIKLEKPLDLVEQTRERRITWGFSNEYL